MSQSKSDLVKMVADKTGNTQVAVKAILDATFEIIQNVAAEDSLIIRDFGVFKTKVRAARTGRNPNTGNTIQIPESKVLSFKATKHKG
jgi:DNA-binding protein HU-beta